MSNSSNALVQTSLEFPFSIPSTPPEIYLPPQVPPIVYFESPPILSPPQPLPNISTLPLVPVVVTSPPIPLLQLCYQTPAPIAPQTAVAPAVYEILPLNLEPVSALTEAVRPTLEHPVAVVPSPIQVVEPHPPVVSAPAASMTQRAETVHSDVDEGSFVDSVYVHFTLL